MTDRPRPSSAGTASKILATGFSVAAGLGLMGLIEANAQSGVASVSPEADSSPVTIIRRVVVTTTQPDVLLQTVFGESRVVIQEPPAPIVRSRTIATGSPAPKPRQQSQSKSSGSK